MKKLAALILLIGMALIVTACGKFTCDLCAEEKSGKKHDTEMLGEKVTVCDDCYKDMQALASMFES